jgi:glycosyltransferase involved in cell wall biosynthesis
MGLEKKKLALFFTCGVTLDLWERVGNFQREIQYYHVLAESFERIYFITYGGGRELRFKDKLAKNIEVLPKNSNLPSAIYQFLIPLKYRKELSRSDFYKTNQMGAAVPAILSKWIYRRRLIVRCGYEKLRFMEKRGTPKYRLMIVYLFEKLVYAIADRILVTSREEKEFVKDRFRIRSGRIDVIPNYVDVDIFRPMNIPKKQNRLFFVGRLSPEKNLYELIKAISGLEAKLIVFGSGALEGDLRLWAKKLNAQVEFRGNIPNHQLPKELNKSQLFILPSLYEGNPKALLEAMACGLPCIATNLNEIKELIQHKANGYLCEIDSESIRKAILEISRDRSLRKTIGQNARTTILKGFRLNDVIDEEIKVYESI